MPAGYLQPTTPALGQGGGYPSAAQSPDAFAASVQQPFPQTDWLAQIQAQHTGPIPGIVDWDAANSLTEEIVTSQVQKNIAESEEARAPLVDEWRLYGDLYQNRQQTQPKSSWQADIFVPEIFTSIEGMKGMIQSALLDSRRWFALEEYPDWNQDFSRVPFIEQIVAYSLDAADFVNEYLKALEEGFLYGSGCLRLYWRMWIERGPRVVQVPVTQDPQQMQFLQYYQQPTTRPLITSQPIQRSALCAAQVPIRACYPDPYSVKWGQENMRYFIEECAEDDDSVKEGVRAGRYDNADNLGAPCAFDLETEYRPEETSLAYSGPKSGRKRHLIQIQHGNIYAQDGRLACQNWKVIVANKKKLLAISPNPMYRGTWPYIWPTPLPMRGRCWGRSLVEAAASMQMELNKLMNLMLDSNTYAVLPAGMVDQDKLDEPVDIESITPGQLYRGKPDAITPFKISSAPNDGWPMTQALEQKIQLATMYNEFMSGAPTAKGRPTAYEIRSKTNAGQSQVNNLAKRVEREDLEPAVQIAYELCLQYLSDTSDPELGAILQQWGGAPDLADPEVRYQLLDANFQVKAKGVSQMLSLDDTLSSQMQLLQLGQQLGIPPEPQVKLYYSICRTMGLDPRTFGEPATPGEMSAFIQQMQAQQMAAAQAGGQGGEALNSAPTPPQTPTAPPQPASPQATANQVQNQGPPMPPGA